jgi:hypothetical protein
MDKNHVITEEELRSIRIGVTYSMDEATEQWLLHAENKAADHKADSEGDTIPGAQKATPWDMLGL